MRYTLSTIFDCLPTETVKASELKSGDVAFVHGWWDLVVNIDVDDLTFNNGANQRIRRLSGNISYARPADDIAIVKRGLFNSAKLEKFIEDHLIEEERLRKLAEEEEQEEIEREKEYLRARLKDLG